MLTSTGFLCPGSHKWLASKFTRSKDQIAHKKKITKSEMNADMMRLGPKKKNTKWK